MTAEFTGKLTQARRAEIEAQLLNDKLDVLRRIDRLKAELQTERDRLADVDDALKTIKEGV